MAPPNCWYRFFLVGINTDFLPTLVGRLHCPEKDNSKQKTRQTLGFKRVSCTALDGVILEIGVPNEIRTRVIAVKGRCPRPLDDGDLNHFGGDKRDRTADLLHAMQALSQLSYTPKKSAHYSDHPCPCKADSEPQSKCRGQWRAVPYDKYRAMRSNTTSRGNRATTASTDGV